MSRAQASATRASGAPARSAAKQPRGYFECSQLPLTSLVFLLPFLAIYEFGATSKDIQAFAWMQQLFGLVGATGKHLPAMTVVFVLLGWQFARRGGWQVDPRHPVMMFFESVVLAFPLILIGMVASHYVPLMALKLSRPLGSVILQSVGAGIYEELVFRLIAFTLLDLLLVDVLLLKRRWAIPLMVVTSSLAFSFYHYLGYEQFQLGSFVFRTLAGFYFAIIFTFRGFGISAGCHTSYDIIVNLARALT